MAVCDWMSIEHLYYCIDLYLSLNAHCILYSSQNTWHRRTVQFDDTFWEKEISVKLYGKVANWWTMQLTSSEQLRISTARNTIKCYDNNHHLVSFSSKFPGKNVWIWCSRAHCWFSLLHLISLVMLSTQHLGFVTMKPKIHSFAQNYSTRLSLASRAELRSVDHTSKKKNQNPKPLQENANAKYMWRFHWKLFPVLSLYYLNANFPNHSSSHVHIKKSKFMETTMPRVVSECRWRRLH